MANRVASNRRIHESTSRGLCRLMFVLLGVFPTLLCIGWVLVDSLPSYQRHRAVLWEVRLSNSLGVDVDLAAVESKAPGRSTLHGLRLKHPETGKTIGSVLRADIQRYSGRWLIELEQPMIDARQLAFAAGKVHDWLLCRPGSLQQATVVRMDRLAVEGLADQHSLSDVWLSIFPRPDSQLLSLKFHHDARTASPGAGQPPAEAQAELIVERHHALPSSMTAVRFKTGSTPLPCSLLGCVLPPFNQLGGQALLAGDFRCQWQDDGRWSLATVKNSPCVLDLVDFGRLTQGSDLVVAGSGNITLHQLSMSEAGIVGAQASVQIPTPGHLGSQLLAVACRHLDIDASPLHAAPGYLTQFSQLYLALELAPQQLRLTGRPGDGVILLDASGNSLAERPVLKFFSQPLQLSRLVDIAGELPTSPQANGPVAAGAASSVAENRLARYALRWLPMERAQPLEVAEGQRLAVER